MLVSKNNERVRRILSKTTGNPRRRFELIYALCKTKTACDDADEEVDIIEVTLSPVFNYTLSLLIVDCSANESWFAEYSSGQQRIKCLHIRELLCQGQTAYGNIDVSKQGWSNACCRFEEKRRVDR